MSTAFIANRKECIYDVDRILKRETIIGQHYKSKFHRQVRKEQSARFNVILTKDGTRLLTDAKKCDHKTFGIAQTEPKSPTKFLRKGQGVKWRRQALHVCPPTAGAPPLPKFVHLKHEPRAQTKPLTRRQEVELKKQLHLMGKPIVHRANFVQLNKQAYSGLCGKLRKPHLVDQATGNAQPLLESGLLPLQTCKKNFGKIPNYLTQRKQQLKEWHNLCRKTNDQLAAKSSSCMSFEQADLKLISEEERQYLMSNLKEALKKFETEFLCLSLHTDTTAKVKRKNKLRQDLQAIEDEIELLESHPVIYVEQP